MSGLTQREYEILELIREGGLAAAAAGPQSCNSETDLLIQHLESCGYIAFGRDSRGTGLITLRITAAGQHALLAFQQEVNHRAQQEKENRFNRKLQITQCVIAALGFLSGLITEHFVGIVEFLVSLFH